MNGTNLIENYGNLLFSFHTGALERKMKLVGAVPMLQPNHHYAHAAEDIFFSSRDFSIVHYLGSMHVFVHNLPLLKLEGYK